MGFIQAEIKQGFVLSMTRLAGFGIKFYKQAVKDYFMYTENFITETKCYKLINSSKDFPSFVGKEIKIKLSEKAVTSLMFSKPLKASSNGLDTCVSTVAGEAPGYVVVTVNKGGEKSGNNS